MLSRPPVGGVLFDLDGTLLDTAPDLVAAANQALATEGLPPCPIEEIKPHISGGARTILGYWLVKAVEQRPVASYPSVNQVGTAYQPLFERLLESMLAYYADNPARRTGYFDGMEAALDALDARGLPWGIVTNKHSRFTTPLAEALHLNRRAGCIVSGDTTAESKPHPLPLLEASQRLGVRAECCVYVGDAARDIEAGRRAGMATLAALYGYIADDEDVDAWGADATLSHPADLLPWIEVNQ
ncbi:phosphoglycolate phosphatase [Methyloparacoccus murrellii]